MRPRAEKDSSALADASAMDGGGRSDSVTTPGHDEKGHVAGLGVPGAWAYTDLYWENKMAIAKAVEQGGIVRVYDERGNLQFSKAGTLHGHTGTTVTIRQGHTVRTYDDKGNQRFPKAV